MTEIELFRTKSWGHCHSCGGVLWIILYREDDSFSEDHQPLWVIVECQDCHIKLNTDIRRVVKYQPGV